MDGSLWKAFQYYMEEPLPGKRFADEWQQPLLPGPYVLCMEFWAINTFTAETFYRRHFEMYFLG